MADGIKGMAADSLKKGREALSGMMSGGMLSKAMKAGGSYLKANPVSGGIQAAGFAIPAVAGLAALVNGGAEAVTGGRLWGRPSTEKMLEMEAQIRREERRRNVMEQERARKAAANTANLIRYAPNVAREVLAGRRLPKGAVVIGGTPRLDLMEQLATEMAEGQHTQKDPLAEILEAR